MKVVYRERPEFTYEHVAEVDGNELKMESGELYIRSHRAQMSGDLNWEKVTGPWRTDFSDREPGVYKIEA